MTSIARARVLSLYPTTEAVNPDLDHLQRVSNMTLFPGQINTYSPEKRVENLQAIVSSALDLSFAIDEHIKHLVADGLTEANKSEVCQWATAKAPIDLALVEAKVALKQMGVRYAGV